MLNEGLEVLGTDGHPDNETRCGIFEESGLERIELPSALRRIECRVFRKCKALRSIKLPSALAYIGRECFLKSGLLDVAVPETGVVAEGDAFDGCPAKEKVVFRCGKVFPREMRE